jgi:hypothetical protein
VDSISEQIQILSCGVSLISFELFRGDNEPEAFVSLAYYGIVLHWCRGFLAFGQAGVPLIHAIVGQLSDYWQEALTWPFQMLQMD